MKYPHLVDSIILYLNSNMIILKFKKILLEAVKAYAFKFQYDNT